MATKLAAFLHLGQHQFLLNPLFGDKYIYLDTEGLFHENHAQTKVQTMKCWTDCLMSRHAAVPAWGCPRLHIKSQHGATCTCSLDTNLASYSLKALF